MSEKIRNFVECEIQKNGLPRTQEGCCAIAARTNLFANGPCSSDAEIIDRAADLARGLFGPAYEKADECQRIAWIDMCECALRNEISAVS